LTPNLAFGGQCEAAFKFYERCLGGEVVTMLTYGKSPMAEQVPARWREKILHATLKVGDNVLMGADPGPERYQQQRVSPWRLASMTLWMQNGYFTRLRKRHSANAPPENLLGRRLWRACRSIRHTLGDQLRASAQRSLKRKGPRQTLPDSRDNPQHLRITRA
jgi:uncharacterized glyoxalase superfamily protein PhnB